MKLHSESEYSNDNPPYLDKNWNYSPSYDTNILYRIDEVREEMYLVELAKKSK